MIKPVLAAALLAIAAPAFAAPDAATVAAATALVQQLDVKGQITQGMSRAVADMRSGAAITRLLQPQPGFEQARAKDPAKFNTVLKRIGEMQADAAQKIVNANTQAVVDAAIQSYATNFTAAELKGLADFYRTPLGIAFAAKQPKVSAEISNASGRIMGSKIEAAMQQMAPQIEAQLRTLQPAQPAGAPPKK